MPDTIQHDPLGYAVLAIKSIADRSKPDDPGRFFSGMLNAHTVDLEGETFEPKGIDTKAFMAAGGPILARHFGETTPEGFSTVIARALSISRRDDGLFINKAEFDTDPLSEHYKGKVQRGFIKCMSAGLLRQEWEYRKKGDREIRVVTRSVLVHGILTAQPVNRESLIGAKSLERMARLERELEALRESHVSAERIQELFDSVKSISEQLETLSMGVSQGGTPPSAVNPEPELPSASVKALAARLDEIAQAARTAAAVKE